MFIDTEIKSCENLDSLESILSAEAERFITEDPYLTNVLLRARAVITELRSHLEKKPARKRRKDLMPICDRCKGRSECPVPEQEKMNKTFCSEELYNQYYDNTLTERNTEK